MNIHINKLNINNIENLNYKLDLTQSTIITGWSGSGKSSFVNALYHVAKRKFILLLPKSEYTFIFKNEEYRATKNSLSFQDTPFIISIENKVTSNTPKATIGTNTGILKSIRKKFAKEHKKSSEFFSFNIPISWCTRCKGKGTFRKEVCTSCNGTRYSKNIENYKIFTKKFGDMTIIEVLSLPLYNLLLLNEELELTQKDILKLTNSLKLNIDYLSLDRSIITLSGGEYARLILVNYLNLSENIVYIIDEPSIGLDSENIKNMIDVLNELGEKNQIFIIDHNRLMRESADKTIIFGEKSGKDGGQIVSNIDIVKCNKFTKVETSDFLDILDIKNRNINMKKLSIPLNAFSVITGESGVGKSSLLQAIIPKIEQEKNYEVIHIEQNKLRGITSKSTIATYLDFMDILKRYSKVKISNCKVCQGSGLDIDNIKCIACNGIGFENNFLQIKVETLTINQILEESIQYIYNSLPKALKLTSLDFLIKLSNGYLSLDRQVNSLSGGEFQRLYLAKQLSLIFNSSKDKQYIIFLDEPSKGLSQNYTNELISLLKSVITNNITLIAIEHNECMIKNADYVADMGKRRKNIDDLSFINQFQNEDSIEKKKFKSSLEQKKSNISFQEAKKQYKSLFKIYSKTAEWIYSDIEFSKHLNPVIAFDFEKDNLYSKNTKLYETLDIYSFILSKIDKNNSMFNLTNSANICKVCKGNGRVNSINFNSLFIDESKPFLKGLVDKEIISILRPYNLDKIKFLFKSIKEEFGYDLSNSYNKMSIEEQNILKYGFLNKRFIYKIKGKSSYQTWQGINHLILKYLRTYKKNQELKENIKNRVSFISCPKCNGELFNHQLDTIIDKTSLREYLKEDANFVLEEILSDKIFKIFNFNIGKISLNDDVSLLDREQQIYLKLLELLCFNLQNYHIHIKNISDFISRDNLIFQLLEEKNILYLHDDFSIIDSKKELFNKIKKISNAKLGINSLVYELFGVDKKDLKKKITLLKKSYSCQFCAGKGKFLIENSIDGLDIEQIDCSHCLSSGIDSSVLLKTKISNFSIYELLNGSKLDILLNRTISSLDKEEMVKIMKHI